MQVQCSGNKRSHRLVPNYLLITTPEDEDCQAAADKAVAAAAVVAAAGHRLPGTSHNTLAAVPEGILDNCTPL